MRYNKSGYNHCGGYKIKRIIKYTLLFLLVFTACRGDQDKDAVVTEKKDIVVRKPAPELKAGAAAPGFSLKKVVGDGSIALSDLRGKVVILDFWATWCPPCKMAIPSLNNLYKKHRASGLEIVGISLDRMRDFQDRDKLLSFMSRFSMEYPVVYANEDVSLAYGGIPSIPIAFIIDREGNFVKSFKGFSTTIEYEIEKIVKKLL